MPFASAEKSGARSPSAHEPHPSSWWRSMARRGDWEAMVTQEWPIGGKTHQFSFTVPFAGAQEGAGIGDVLVNYRFQLMDEDGRRPAIAPRVSLVLPTSRDRFESRIPG